MPSKVSVSRGSGRSTRALVEAGLAVALALVLHQVRLFAMPQGGSVTLGSAVPIWIVARRHGVRTGMLAGAALGTLLVLMGGKGVHWFQLVLDYPAAAASLGLAGLGARANAPLILSGIVRYLCCVVSGVVFFGQVGMSMSTIVATSATYNLSVLADVTIAGVLLGLLVKRAPQLVAPQGIAGNAPQ